MKTTVLLAFLLVWFDSTCVLCCQAAIEIYKDTR